jgi:hypothetical protein
MPQETGNLRKTTSTAWPKTLPPLLPHHDTTHNITLMKATANAISKTLRALSLLLITRQAFSLSPTTMTSSIKVPKQISIRSAGFNAVNGVYQQKHPTVIPSGFDRTCRSMNWDTAQMWNQLSDQRRPWYEAENESYVYWNKGDGKWWIDGPSGAGVYIVKNAGWVPPKSGWISLDSDYQPVPTVLVEGGE